jgi:hypothetical protein
LSLDCAIKLLLKLTNPTLSLGLPLAQLSFDLSLILYPLTFFASHHDLQGLNLTAETFDLISLGAEYCLLLALSLLFLLFKVGDSLLNEKELGIELVDLSSCEVQVLAP